MQWKKWILTKAKQDVIQRNKHLRDHPQ